MRLRISVITVFLCLICAGCNNSSSSDKKAIELATSKDSIHVDSIPITNLGPNLSLSDVPVGTFVFHTFRYTHTYPGQEDGSYEHIASNDSITFEKMGQGYPVLAFGATIPMKISSTRTHFSFINTLFYHAEADTNNKWNWFFRTEISVDRCDDLAILLRNSLLSRNNIYESDPNSKECIYRKNNAELPKMYSVAFQMSGDFLYITYQNRWYSGSKADERTQIIYQKTNLTSSDGDSVTFNK